MKKKIKTSDGSAEAKLMTPLSRRSMLKGVGLSGAVLVSGYSGSVIAKSTDARSPQARIQVTEAYETLTAAESAALDAFVSRILPSDDGTPGAREARVAHFIDRGLTGAMAGSREMYAIGLAALDAYAIEAGGTPFHLLLPSVQDAIIETMTNNAIPTFPMLNSGFFNAVRNHTIEGAFSDPYYGGNRDFIGWDLIGYPGVRIVSSPEDARQGRGLAPSRQSAYDLPAYTKDSKSSISAEEGVASHGH